MKKLTIVALIFTVPMLSVAQGPSKLRVTEDSSIFSPKTIAYSTPNKDTLYLLKSEIGSRIASLWNKDSYNAEKNGQKPTIIFVDRYALDKIAKK